MPRFFRRIAEGVFDLEDLALRTAELAEFVLAAATRYGFDPGNVVAVGISNGANIAASLLLTRPELLRAAVLFRAMVPFEPARPPVLSGVPVWLGAGRADPMVPAANTERLAALLRAAGASVTLEWQPGGHGLAEGEIEAAARWLSGVLSGGA
jgi:phospholipase/carboxylesterase/glyoxalase family protein